MIFRDKIKAAYKEVFSTPAGQLVLDDLIAYGRLFKSHPIANEHAQRCEGMRSVMLYILDKISNKQYKEMVNNQLNYDEQAQYDRIFADTDNGGQNQ